MYSSPARLRIERDATRRSNAGAIISTLLSLLVVGAAIGAVAYFVLRTPSSAVDSAERLEPIGTALPAPSDPPAVSTPIPTPEPSPEPEPTALGFTGEAPAVAGLPTVAASQEVPPETSGPTPTPRVIALATAVPPTAAPPAPTLPPPVDVTAVPVVELAPVEAAPPPPPTAVAPQPEGQVVSEPTPVPVVVDDDPFNIFGDGDGSGIVAAQNDALERARALQAGNGDRAENGNRDNANPVIMEAPIAPSDGGRDGTVEVVMPDVDAMIEEITARAINPDANPNVGNAGQRDSGRARNSDENRSVTEPRENRRKSARERIAERRGRSSTANSASVIEPVIPNVPVVVPVIPEVPVIVPSGRGNSGQECEDPFANLPADMRPDNFPFNNC